MYVWWKEKKIGFLYKEKNKDFSLRIYVQKTNWETTLLRHHVELRWKLKVFSSLDFEFHYIKVHFLCFVLEFKVTCYLSWMKQIRVCCFRCVFCMRCKTRFSNNWYQSSLQYHACITCNWVFRIKENSFLGDLIFCSKIST